MFKFSKTKLVKNRAENSKYRKNGIKITKKASKGVGNRLKFGGCIQTGIYFGILWQKPATQFSD